jgi:hypothetical protein
LTEQPARTAAAHIVIVIDFIFASPKRIRRCML